MLYLNGFLTQFAGPGFDVLKAQMEPTNVKVARESLGEHWFSLYHEGSLYSLAKSELATNGLGSQTKLVLDDHLGCRFASALLVDARIVLGTEHKT